MGARETFIIGLTGGIATGKSRVSALLERLGAAVVCADSIVREIQAPGSPALGEIAETFGPQFLLPTGELDRQKLGALVFGDLQARRRLEGIIHPRVTRIMTDRLESLRRSGSAVAVLDIPLLLEGRKAGRGTGAVLHFDEVVLVYADPVTQVERLVARDGISREDALARVRAQMPIDEKRAMADTVIDNTGPWEKTERQVRELYARWISASPSRSSG